MIRIWYSRDESYHEFGSVSEVGDWIGACKNPSIVAADGHNNTLKIMIGSPTKREAEVKESAGADIIEHGTFDRTTGIRTFLHRLEELYPVL